MLFSIGILLNITLFKRSHTSLVMIIDLKVYNKKCRKIIECTFKGGSNKMSCRLKAKPIKIAGMSVIENKQYVTYCLCYQKKTIENQVKSQNPV